LTALDVVAACFDIVAPGCRHFIRTVTENRARISPHRASVGVPMRSELPKHPLVVGPDGYPYALLTGPDSIAIARLDYAG
jgi:hypothetical protein